MLQKRAQKLLLFFLSDRDERRNQRGGLVAVRARLTWKNGTELIEVTRS